MVTEPYPIVLEHRDPPAPIDLGQMAPSGGGGNVEARLRQLKAALDLLIQQYNGLLAFVQEIDVDGALAAFTGTENIATVGTITVGTWNGTPIASGYIADWDLKQDFMPGVVSDFSTGGMHIQTAASGDTADADADDLIIENNASGGISILVPSNSYALIDFGNGGQIGYGGSTVSYAPDRDAMYFDTNGTTRVLIDSSGNVGIGMVPIETLDVTGTLGISGRATIVGGFHAGESWIETNTAGEVTADTAADDLVIENSTDAGLSILSPANSYGLIFFGGPDGNARGRIGYGGSNVATETDRDAMFFTTAGTFSMMIDADGNLGIGMVPSETLDVAGTLQATTAVESAVAIRGVATAAGGVGIQGNSTNSRGVYGVSDNNIGVKGEGPVQGVYGLSVAGIGVRGSSTDDFGVYGTSVNSPAMKGLSTNNAGVQGSSTNSLGIYGTSSNSIGIKGEGATYGLQGFTTTGVGIKGTSTSGYGVWGESTSNNGVLGISSSGTGVRGETTTGFAGYFVGQTKVIGTFEATENATFSTIIAGTWNGDVIGSAYGGLGADISGYTGMIGLAAGVASQVNSTVVGVNMLEAADVAAQLTLLGGTTAGVDMFTAASAAAQTTLLGLDSNDSVTFGSVTVGAFRSEFWMPDTAPHTILYVYDWAVSHATMTIDTASHEVGINCNPGKSLDVNGTFRVSGISTFTTPIADASIASAATWNAGLLPSLGSANQVLGMNAAGTALEWKTFSGTSNRVTISKSAGSFTFSAPQDLAVGSSVTFNNVTITTLTRFSDNLVRFS